MLATPLLYDLALVTSLAFYSNCVVVCATFKNKKRLEFGIFLFACCDDCVQNSHEHKKETKKKRK